MTKAEDSYVKKCIRKKKIPAKFRRELEVLGIKFQGETYQGEECLLVILPPGYHLYRVENFLFLDDSNGQHVLETQLIKRNNEKYWSRCGW